MVRTYAEAGVDIEKEAKSIDMLRRQLRFRREGIGSLIDLPGFFTGIVDFGEYALSLCTDGVGTKLLVANAMKKWDTVGIDCIALNVNDMICVGAEPIAFVDYFAVEKYDEEIARQIGVGLNEGARLANVSIVGGEFSTIPEIVKNFDLAGTCLGYVRKDGIITGNDIEAGDRIIGLKSSGIHSNGLTLARKVFQSAGYSYFDKMPDSEERVGEALLEPSRIYVRPIVGLLKKVPVKGMANITGGGLRNLVRLKEDVEFRITDRFEPQPVFGAIRDLGDIGEKEMYQTFNMGLGFVVIVSRENAEIAVRELNKTIETRIIGEVVEGSGVTLPASGLAYERY